MTALKKTHLTPCLTSISKSPRKSLPCRFMAGLYSCAQQVLASGAECVAVGRRFFGPGVLDGRKEVEADRTADLCVKPGTLYTIR